jgi:hypothetical protein
VRTPPRHHAHPPAPAAHASPPPLPRAIPTTTPDLAVKAKGAGAGAVAGGTGDDAVVVVRRADGSRGAPPGAQLKCGDEGAAAKSVVSIADLLAGGSVAVYQ